MKIAATGSILSLILLLPACSSVPVSGDAAAMVPSERVYRPDFVGPAPAADQATVVFQRDAGFGGAGCSHDIFVDNVKAFSIRQREHITIHLPAGPHFFRLETGGGLCPNVATSQDAQLPPGARVVYRILLPSDGSLRLTREE